MSVARKRGRFAAEAPVPSLAESMRQGETKHYKVTPDLTASMHQGKRKGGNSSHETLGATMHQGGDKRKRG